MSTVSIVLPVHDCADALPGCLAALDAMDLTGHEVLVVDDGSSDGTLALVRAWAEKRDDVVVLAQPVNRGVAAARNLALTYASRRYVWFLDHDDSWDPQILRVLVTEAERTNADLVVCRAVRTTAEGRVREMLDGFSQARVLDARQTVAALLAGRVRGYLWNKLFRRSVVPPGMFPAMTSQSDLAGLVPLLPRLRSTAFVPDVLYRHIARDGSITNSRDPDLQNLRRCRDEVRAAVHQLGDPPDLLAAYLRWESLFFALALANTALRLGSGSSFHSAPLSEARRTITWRALPGLVAADRSRGLRAALVKGAGPAYPAVYRATVRLRERVERLPGERRTSAEGRDGDGEVHVYVRCTAQDDNLGDVVLRRRALRSLRAAGRLHVFVGPASDGLLEALSLSPSDTIYRQEADWRRSCLERRRGSMVLADQPGEFQMQRYYVWQQLRLVPMARHVRRHGGTVVRAGLGARSHHPLFSRLLKPLMTHADVLAWRDEDTRSSLRGGGTMPDWAFDDLGPDVDATHAPLTGPPATDVPQQRRGVLAVSMRGDRPAPPPEWVEAVRAFCTDRSLRPVVVTQVHRDGARSRDLARLLHADLVAWSSETHRDQELHLRDVYRRSEMVLSDRLHVLIVALTEGATPVCVTSNPEVKVGRHFDEICLPGVSTEVADVTTADIVTALDVAHSRRTEAQAQLQAARTRVRRVDARIVSAAGGAR